MNLIYGFSSQCSHKLGSEYGARFYEIANDTFEWLPLAALVDGSVLVCHGGLGDGQFTLDDLRNKIVRRCGAVD